MFKYSYDPTDKSFCLHITHLKGITESPLLVNCRISMTLRSACSIARELKYNGGRAEIWSKGEIVKIYDGYTQADYTGSTGYF